MDNKLVYETKRKISSVYIDSQVKLGVYKTAILHQDNFTECFDMLKVDGVRVKRDYNDFWVFTRARFNFIKRPEWTETVTVATFPVSNAGLRTNVNTSFKDEQGNLLITVNQEACVLDCDKHRPVKLSSIPYPKEGFPEPVMNEPFEKFTAEFTEDDFVFEHTVRSQEIDLSHHLNNTEYVRLALDTFSTEFMENHEIKTLEIHFTGESTEGQVLKIYRKDTEEGTSYLRIMQDLRTVAELMIKY